MRAAVVLLITFFFVLSQAYAEDGPVFIVMPTVICFFSPVTERDLENDSALNEVLSDFQYHLGNATPFLEKKHVRVVELYAKKLTYVLDGKNVLFHPKQRIGYFMAAPGRSPKVAYGVMTDVDLGNAVDAYLNANNSNASK